MADPTVEEIKTELNNNDEQDFEGLGTMIETLKNCSPADLTHHGDIEDETLIKFPLIRYKDIKFFINILIRARYRHAIANLAIPNLKEDK